MSLSVLLLILSASQAFANGQDRGGGETEKLKFTIIANKVISIVRENSLRFPEVDLRKLGAAVGNTKIRITPEDLTLAGESVVAINEPQRGVIHVNRFKWRGLSGNPTMQVTIVAHEYFGILGLDDSNGQISSRLAALVGESRTAFFRWSCSAVAISEGYHGSGRRLHVLGEGDTAGEAWKELLEGAEGSFKDEAYLLRAGTETQLGVPYVATLLNSCVKND
jgi:hypothetical protein